MISIGEGGPDVVDAVFVGYRAEGISAPQEMRSANWDQRGWSDRKGARW